MARKGKAPPRWRAPFLRALTATGNAREAARAAGVDHSLAYYHRRRDPAFAAEWEAALEEARAAAETRRANSSLHDRSNDPPSGAGEDLVLRRSRRCGDQLVRAGSGRWNKKAEAAFLRTLARSANVRRSARAAGFSTTALYARREAYPGFAERWDQAIERSKAHLHAFIVSAGIESFDPDEEEEGGNCPRVTVAEAIAILKLRGQAEARPNRGARYGPPEPSIAEVRRNIMRKLDAIEAHGKGKEGDGEE